MPPTTVAVDCHPATPDEFSGHRVDHSVFLPFLADRPEQFVPFMALVQRSRAVRLWSGQPLRLDTCQGFAFAAGMGLRAPVGTAVTLMPTRHPFEMALQARGLALTTGHPVIVGLGTGSVDFQRGLLGRPYERPLRAVREYLQACRDLVDGRSVDVAGDSVTLRGKQGRLSHPPVHWGLGVLRPGMARLAGELADVAITWLTPPAYIRDELVPRIRAAASAAGRPAPRVVAAVHVALATPGTDPVEVVGATSEGHLRAPHYQDMLRQAGVRVNPADWRVAAGGLLETGTVVVDALPHLERRLHAYVEAGVDEIALHLHAPRGPAAATEAVVTLQAVLDALTRSVPSPLGGRP